MADKPKKGKGKLVGKKKAVKKAKPSAAPVEQGSGLNVESKPKSQSQSIQEKQEARLAEKVKSHREQEDAKNLTQMRASTPKETSSFQGGMKALKEKKAANKGLLEGMAEGAKKFPGPKDEKKQMAAMDMTSKMAKHNYKPAPKEPFVSTATYEHKPRYSRTSSPEGIGPSTEQQNKAIKNYAVRHNLLTGDHDQHGNNLKNFAHGHTASTVPGEKYGDASKGDYGVKNPIKGLKPLVEKLNAAKQKTVKADPMAAQMSASAKSFTGPTASQKVIAGMSQAGQQAKAKKQKKLDAFKNIGAKAKSAFTGPNKPKKSEKFLSGIENLFGEIDAHNNKKSGKPYSLPKSPANFRQNAKNAFQKMKADSSNKGKAASDPTLKNPFSGRTKQSSEAKHNSPERGPIYKGEHANDKKRSAEKPVSALKKEVAAPQSSSPSLASKVGGAIKSVATHPTTTGFLKATGVHLGMAAMHGTNYPRVMAQHASQGPREFKPGWHGFTSPVERPKAEEGTDTKGERA